MGNMNETSYKLFDCGCVQSRPRTATVFACRWRVYRSLNFIVLKCRDCGRVRHFALRRVDEEVCGYDRSQLGVDMSE
jgi:hypothetical protein